MSKNKTLSAAKSAKNDEFYTQYNDIQKEVNAYLDYDPDTFRGKTVLLPCDDPEWSKFTRFFAENFERLGLKKLISTSYAAASKKIGELSHAGARRGGGRVQSLNAPSWYQPSLFEQQSPHFDAKKTAVRGKIFVLDHDTNKSGRIDLDDLQWNYMEGDGDFRSEEVCRLRDEADVIVTNPPFSLFREFLAWILEGKSLTRIPQPKAVREADALAGVRRGEAEVGSRVPRDRDGNVLATKNTKSTKQFLIIGNKNVLNTKDVFPLVMSNLLWSGRTEWAGGMWFETKYEDDVDRVENGVNMKNVASIWLTNMEHGRRHQPLQLMTMADNLRYSRHKEIKEHGYRHYDNYDAIEVPFSDAIPSDYDGVMGVPVTFLDKFCPEQFEIVGITKTWFGSATKIYPEQIQVDANGTRKTVTKLNDGAVLKIDAPLHGATYYEIGDEKFIQTYPRILIRARRSK